MKKANETCFVCGGVFGYYLSGKDYLYETSKKSYKLYKCQSCGLERLLPVPTQNEIEKFYPETYYSYNFDELNSNNKSLFVRIREKILERRFSNTIKKNYIFYLSLISEFLLSGMPLKNTGKNRFLDIGCGDGYNVRLLNKYGWKAIGYEIGKKSRKGNIYFDRSFDKVDFKNKQFDYIRIWHVLEHVPDPIKLIDRAVDLLSDEGKIVIGIPNTSSLYSKLFGKYWFGRDMPRHLTGFNKNNIKQFLEKKELKIIEIKFIGVGGICGSLQNLINDKFNRDFDLVNNLAFVLIFLPIDLIVNFLKIGDIISLSIVKSKKY